MGTVADKLNKLIETKEAIKTSLQNKGVEVADTDTFANYAEKIDSIETGGDLSEYFNTNPTELSPGFGRLNFVLKMPDLVIPDNITKIAYLFGGASSSDPYRYPVAPKVIFNNNVTNLQYAFSYINGPATLDLSGINTENVTTMGYCFSDCSSLTELDLSNFKTNNATHINQMFKNCKNLIRLDLSNFITNKCVFMNGMFDGCNKLETIVGIENFNISNATSIERMFYNCQKLTSLNLGNWVLNENVTSLTYMFSDCKSLTHLDIRNFDFTNITSYLNMFGNSVSPNIPLDCLIIVKDDTAKEWITSKFTTLTNVKTVAELGE